jgi:predicted peptidase
MDAHVIAAIDQAIATLHVDPHRVYLVGNSMGGHGALHLAARHADRFAAMVSVAGRAGRSRWFPAPPDSVEDLPHEGAEDVLADTLVAVPTWLFHGGDDSITEAEASSRMAAALRERGDEVRLTIYPDVGHAGAWERAWADPALFAWLLQHRRP